MVVGAPWIDVVDGGDALGPWLYQADAMMATSGTVTMQTALHGVPGVTAYKWLHQRGDWAAPCKL